MTCEKQAEGHAKTYKTPDFQLHNPLKFKLEGSRVKNLDGTKNSLICALNIM
jgi:hypothetical protein